MLNWSSNRYKFTLGIGSLGIVGMLSELGRPTLPAWAAVTIALMPLGAFLFFSPDDMPRRVVRFAHLFGSIWYLATVIGLITALIWIGPLPRGWQLFLTIIMIGAVPCFIVIYETVGGRYGTDKDSTNSTLDETDLDSAFGALPFQSKLGNRMTHETSSHFHSTNGLDQEYEYKPKWTVMIFCGLIFMAVGIFFGREALSNDRGLVINGIIELSAKNATIFYWLCTAFCGTFVFLMGLMALSRVMIHQRIAFTRTCLMIPKSSWSSEELAIEYRSISEVTVSEISGQRFMYVHYAGKKMAIVASMLPSKAIYDELCANLHARIEHARNEGANSESV